ncbi:MAG TPA: hypothetical protein DCM40_42800 [Maribacter sp.]|nr:hypothetical protein [Maribacter sp.]
MLKGYLLEKQQKLLQQQSNFYTSTGLHVFFKDPVKNIDIESVIEKVESSVPVHLLSEVEMIIFGWFEEFEERALSAFYDGGTLYISNKHKDFNSVYDDIVHEISHSIEEPYGYFIYGDKKIEDEFLRKRKYLHDILWNMDYKIPLSVAMDPEYNEEFDMFLYKKVGYDKLEIILSGIFISPYAATSLREYFATGFAEFFTNPDLNSFLQKVSPELYKKLILLQNSEELDNQ